MDIEALWAVGGYCFLLSSPSSSNCMATTTTTTIRHHHHQYLVLLILFLFLLLITPSPAQQGQLLHSPISVKRVVLDSSSSTTVDLQQPEEQVGKRGHDESRPRWKPRRDEHQFGAEEHEVPSGPNPISN
ncbi:unnamed protein product [Linum tenue]|uniref:Uncharacterized protein n=1 Tax=Linum tenue TaxID=586396 RepID=A0AAV0RTV6_9ROSI|nr:unnamed protein product [Linum tenue]